MNKILILSLLSICSVTSVQASELFGSISTNPNSQAVSSEANTTNSNALNANASAVGPMAAVVVPPQNPTAPKPSVKPALKTSPVTTVKNKAEGAILGVKIYDNVLLRNPQERIYFVRGKSKKHIPDLKSLQRYRGQKIYEVSDAYLFQFRTQSHLDGELVREAGDMKVYVIEGGTKRHVRSLKELRTRYSGQEIYKVSRKTIDSYD